MSIILNRDLVGIFELTLLILRETSACVAQGCSCGITAAQKFIQDGVFDFLTLFVEYQ